MLVWLSDLRVPAHRPLTTDLRSPVSTSPFTRMPEISRFLGLVISMYFGEHSPPHFHVRYNEHRAVVSIADCSVLDGALPPRVRGLVTEWAELHQTELLSMWQSKDFHKIEPLV